ncbi:MAG: sulfite exporter TauE/SafE family protein [Candidatus Wildermuthbacteria bacterium]|nr:sulfite exporter TauE/SafE family protein [Candidatus Wildermuthbacteria bacterium]
MDISLLIIPAFIAGILTFLAPCTLPLVPGYLSFISGSSAADLRDPARRGKAKTKVFLNGLFYVLGFSLVFIVLGSLVGLGGNLLLDQRAMITRIGGFFVILFGVFLLVPNLVSKIPLLNVFAREYQLPFLKYIKPGNPFSSLVFGATFAFGWTPCIGPVLGTLLTLAAASATLSGGIFLLSVYSLGLAVPFLLTALFIGWATEHLQNIGRVLPVVSMIGGVFLIILGIFMVTDKFSVWVGYAYRFLNILRYDAILDYL